METPGDENAAPAEELAPNMTEAAAGVAQLEARVAAAEEKTNKLEQTEKDLSDRLLRVMAEYDNHRKRSKTEFDTAFNNGVCFSANQLLPIIDTLEMAANAESTDAEYKKGVLMTLAKCREVFEKLGIKEIAAEGHPFDPEVHNACMQQPADGAESGTVTAVVQKGYMLGDKVIRHAMVAVAP